MGEGKDIRFIDRTVFSKVCMLYLDGKLLRKEFPINRCNFTFF